MKVLLVLHHFLPEFPSGVEVYTYHLAQELRKRHDVVLFFSTESPATSPNYTIQDGIFDGLIFRSVVNRGQSMQHFSETYHNAHISAIFSEFLDAVRPDIAHVHHLLTLSMDILSQLRQRGIPIVFTLHDFWLQCPLFTRRKSDSTLCWTVELDECARCAQPTIDWSEKGLLGRVSQQIGRGHAFYLAQLQARERVMKRAVDEVSLFLGPSQFLLEEFYKWGLPRDKSLHSPYGHKILGRASSTRQEYLQSKVRFGFIGSIVPHKGLHVLLEAFRKLEEATAELHIFGGFYDDLNYQQHILSLAEGDTRIVFHGRFLPHALAEAYTQFDVQVVPSVWFENSPLTINEAFINKTPVITSNIGGMQELVKHGVNGLTFTVGDPVSLRECLRSLITNPNLITVFAERIPQIKTIEENARELERLYAQLVDHPESA